MKNPLLDKIKSKSARLCMIGLGYVGLPTALIFAEKGYKVIGCDTKQQFVDAISNGKSPLEDLALDKRIEKVVKAGRLRATSDIKEAVSSSDIVLIAVPTPTKDAFNPDLSFIISAGKGISQVLRKGQMIVLESTVYPGVTEEVLKPILEKSRLRAGKDFGLIYCPERYNPGDIDHTIDKVIRVIGGAEESWTRVAKMLYESITEVFVVSSIRTAEMAKIIENTQRDLNIALMNEIALICERIDIDVMEVIEAAATKWNFNVYYPGAGVGGHCLPKDPWYLVKLAEKHGYHAKIITAGRSINDSMPKHISELLMHGLNMVGKPMRKSRVIVLGLSYKENVGDVRNSPSKSLINEIKKMGGIVISIDPFIDNSTAHREFEIDRHYRRLDSKVGFADAIVLMTSHNEFQSLRPRDFAGHLPKGGVLIDGRRIYDGDKIRAQGMIYLGIGKGNNN